MGKNVKMIKCPCCDSQIASTAKACPKCGAKIKKPIYKHVWFYLLIIIVFVIGFVKIKNMPKSYNSLAKEAQSVDVKDIVIESFMTNEATAIQKFDGKVLKVTGIVKDTGASNCKIAMVVNYTDNSLSSFEPDNHAFTAAELEKLSNHGDGSYASDRTIKDTDKVKGSEIYVYFVNDSDLASVSIGDTIEVLGICEHYGWPINLKNAYLVK